MGKHKNKDINYALVEDKRPPIYTSMKYWGKKPHNIWREYIKNYTSKTGIFMDPFSGSAMSAFESYVAGRKSIALDLNPLTSFIIETVCSDFNEEIFINTANSIINSIMINPIYKSLYAYNDIYDRYFVHNVKWNNNNIYEVCLESIDGTDRICLSASEIDYLAVNYSENLLINNIYPKKEFRNSDSYSNTFLENIGTRYCDLYTKRNLWVLSELFNKINSITEINLKMQLLYAFIQIVHLSTKMCVPRSKSTNRDFSTSWGRAAFLYSKKQMEMNPLLLFKNSCFGKQSTLKCLCYAKKYFKRIPKIADINKVDFDPLKDIDIWYGIVDIKKIDKIIPSKSVDFILTDPPYGGLIQYLDLSSVWLSWLELFDNKYSPNYEEEITINGQKDYKYFEDSFSKALKILNKLLKDDGKIVLTFNNKDLRIWSTFLKSIENAGFKIEKVIHQQNKRTSESNVVDHYGMSSNDYYLRCVKSNEKYLKNYSREEIEKIILEKIKEIILERGEPTPYQILFNGLLSKLSYSNIDISLFDSNLNTFFNKYINKELIIYKKATNLAGDYWWIYNKKYIKESKNTLTYKLRKFINKIFENNFIINENVLLQKIFKKFPNGLTPDIEVMYNIINEFADKKGNIFFKR